MKRYTAIEKVKQQFLDDFQLARVSRNIMMEKMKTQKEMKLKLIKRKSEKVKSLYRKSTMKLQ